MKHIYLLTFLLLSLVTVAQQNYFQQEVNYKIDVKLDDENHTLNGFEEFEYQNNSATVLTEIYIHLWPNAYKNENTALAKQQYNDGDDFLQFAKEKDRGWIDSLDFKVDGKAVKLIYDEAHIDIAKLVLNTPLEIGKSINISTPFRVKIPNAKISRLGHVNESYMITQWYPKPAVFDKDGWHAMPYLGQGEFYSEYGSFEVNITLPKNYVVAATGDLQEESEIAFLNARAASTKQKFEDGSFVGLDTKSANVFPESDMEFKTISYKQQNVHDFAWFADKRFEVLVSEVELPHSKRVVKSYAMFTPKNAKLWEDATEYINDGTYYYSLWNGDYPYNSVTAIDGTIAAGGGMEYPNVTVIGNTHTKLELEIVIVHEVGHNWFYGILGSNERDHAWMDEGLNTLNEVRYIQTKYAKNTYLSDMIGNGRFNFHGTNYHDNNDLAVRAVQSFGLDQPIELSSADYTSTNYGFIVYGKTGLVFHYMKSYLGNEKFDAVMRKYYDTWKFKHPQPADIRKVFETETGEDLTWFFDDIIKTTYAIDYKIKNVKTTENGTSVKVKNVGQVAGPIPVTIVNEKGVKETKWSKAGEKTTVLQFPKVLAQKVSIDPTKQIPETNRTNNTWEKARLFNKVEPLKLTPIFAYNKINESNLQWFPAMGMNSYDKLMLGLGLHNFQGPFNKFNFIGSAMYSFGNNMPAGFAELMYNIRPKKGVKLARLGLSVKSFKDKRVGVKNDGYYLALNPYLNLELGNRLARNPHANNLLLETMYKINYGFAPTKEAGAFAQYRYKFSKPDHKIETKLRASYIFNSLNDELGRVTAEAKYKYRYTKEKGDNWVSIRGFIGSNFIHNVSALNNRYNLPLSGRSGSQDLFMEEYYFGRNMATGLWSQQRNEDMGGFNSVSSISSTSWMATANFFIDVPRTRRLIGAYSNVGVFESAGAVYQALDVGMALSLADVLKVYFPIWNNQTVENGIASSKYQERIRFTLKMNLVNQDKIFEKLR